MIHAHHKAEDPLQNLLSHFFKWGHLGSLGVKRSFSQKMFQHNFLKAYYPRFEYVLWL